MLFACVILASAVDDDRLESWVDVPNTEKTKSINVDREGIRKAFEKHRKSCDAGDREKLDRLLIDHALVAMKFTYSPYSEFPVGSAVLSKEGDVFLGCNVENASYGCTICAERTALVKAVSEGVKEFDTVAVVCEKNKDAWPCGACRQFIAEFGSGIRVIVEGSDGMVHVKSIGELLPNMFGPGALGK